MTATQSVVLTATVKGGKLDLSEWQRKLIGDYLTRREGKPVVVKMAPPTNTRSVRANRLYWGAVLGTLASETGNSTEDLLLVLKDMFLPRKFVTLGGKEVEVRKSTADLSADEFSKYLKQIAAWSAAELGIVIPIDV
jgi:hypothetical protein